MNYTDILIEINLLRGYTIHFQRLEFGDKSGTVQSISDETEDISGFSASWAIYCCDHKLAKTMYKCLVN